MNRKPDSSIGGSYLKRILQEIPGPESTAVCSRCFIAVCPVLERPAIVEPSP